MPTGDEDLPSWATEDGSATELPSWAEGGEELPARSRELHTPTGARRLVLPETTIAASGPTTVAPGPATEERDVAPPVDAMPRGHRETGRRMTVLPETTIEGSPTGRGPRQTTVAPASTGYQLREVEADPGFQKRDDASVRPVPPPTLLDRLRTRVRGHADAIEGVAGPLAPLVPGYSMLAATADPDAAARGAVNAVSLGFSDEYRGAADTAAGAIAGQPTDYRAARDEHRRAMREAEERSPGAFGVGEIAGSAPSVLIPGAGPTTVLGRIAMAGGQGALGGMIRGAGESEAEETIAAYDQPSLARDAIEQGALEGVMSAGMAGASEAAVPLAQRLGRWATGAGERMVEPAARLRNSAAGARYAPETDRIDDPVRFAETLRESGISSGLRTTAAAGERAAAVRSESNRVITDLANQASEAEAAARAAVGPYREPSLLPGRRSPSTPRGPTPGEPRLPVDDAAAHVHAADFSEGPRAYRIAREVAVDDVQDGLLDWVASPSSDFKREMARRWESLDESSRRAYAQHIRDTFRETFGDDTIVVYRAMREGDSVDSMGMASVTTDPSRVTGTNKVAFEISHSDVLAHHGEPGSALASRTYGHEREIILRPDARPRRLQPDAASPAAPPITNSRARPRPPIPGTVTIDRLAAGLGRIRDEIDGQGAPAAGARTQLDALLDRYREAHPDGVIPLSDLMGDWRAAGNPANFRDGQPWNVLAQSGRSLRREFRSLMEEAMESASGPEARARLATALERVHAGRTVERGARRVADRQSGNRLLSPTDYYAAGTGATAGMMSGDPLTGVAAAALAAGANRAVRGREHAIGALALETLAPRLRAFGARGQTWAQTLEAAQRRGSTSLAAAHAILQRRDPAYRQAIEEMDEAAESGEE